MTIDITYLMDDDNEVELVCEITPTIDNDGIGHYECAGREGYDSGYDYIAEVKLDSATIAETDTVIDPKSKLFEKVEAYLNTDDMIEKIETVARSQD